MTDPSHDERILGIVGGTGPESTVDYSRSLIATWRRPDGSYPRVIINSIEAGRVFGNLAAAYFAAVGRDLGPAVAALAAAGCQRALLAWNASHLAFELIEPRPQIPLIHIVDAARDAGSGAGFRRLGLIGTRFVMESTCTRHAWLLRLGVVLPTTDERELVHGIYFGELVAGVIRDVSRDPLSGRRGDAGARRHRCGRPRRHRAGPDSLRAFVRRRARAQHSPDARRRRRRLASRSVLTLAVRTTATVRVTPPSMRRRAGELQVDLPESAVLEVGDQEPAWGDDATRRPGRLE
jgi:aspartate racemase